MWGNALGLRLALEEGEEDGEPDSLRANVDTRNSVGPRGRGDVIMPTAVSSL